MSCTCVCTCSYRYGRQAGLVLAIYMVCTPARSADLWFSSAEQRDSWINHIPPYVKWSTTHCIVQAALCTPGTPMNPLQRRSSWQDEPQPHRTTPSIHAHTHTHTCTYMSRVSLHSTPMLSSLHDTDILIHVGSVEVCEVVYMYVYDWTLVSSGCPF